MAISLPIHVGPRMRRVLRYLGLALLALVVFVFALQLTFPYGRVKDKLIEALSDKYEVTIGAVEPGIMPGRVAFKTMTFRTRPEKADDVPTTFFIERLDLDLGLLSLLRGAASVDFVAKIGPGSIRGEVELSKQLTKVAIAGSSLPSALLPMGELIGLPMSGTVKFTFDLELPSERTKTGRLAQNWQKAKGAVAFDCPTGCTFGDGKTRIQPKLTNARQQAFAGDGIEFGKVNVDSLSARIAIQGGKLTLTKFDMQSADGELDVDFDMTLAQVFGESTVEGCLRFKGSEELMKREPKTHAALSTTGADLRDDGLFHIKLEGTFKNLRRRNAQCGPGVADDDRKDAGRPNLTIQPPDETLRGERPELPKPVEPAPAADPTPTEPAPGVPSANRIGLDNGPDGADADKDRAERDRADRERVERDRELKEREQRRALDEAGAEAPAEQLEIDTTDGAGQPPDVEEPPMLR
jgi:type II secretion system protein N